MLSMLADGGPETEGTIDMNPCTHFVRDVADLTDRIAGASIHVTRLDTNDRRPGYARQKRWFHASLPVRRNDLHAAFAETKQCQRFEHRRMNLLADDHRDGRG